MAFKEQEQASAGLRSTAALASHTPARCARVAAKFDDCADVYVALVKPYANFDSSQHLFVTNASTVREFVVIGEQHDTPPRAIHRVSRVRAHAVKKKMSGAAERRDAAPRGNSAPAPSIPDTFVADEYKCSAEDLATARSMWASAASPRLAKCGLEVHVWKLPAGHQL
jgi:hypothetical protein